MPAHRRPIEPMIEQLTEFRNRELLRLWAEVMTTLRERRVIRSSNNPVGDYCERLVAHHFKVELESNSRAGHDLIANGQRIQVKGRRWTPDSSPSHYSVFRGMNEKKFDVFIGVHLDEDFTVRGAWMLPWRAVKRLAKPVTYVNGFRLPIIQGALLHDAEVEEIKLRAIRGD